MTSRKTLPVSILIAALCLPAMIEAQAPQGPPPAGPQGRSPMPPTGPLEPHALTPTVYWVQGGVGNTGFVIGSKGVIVIDATISQKSAKELLEVIGKITTKPVTAVLLTHGDIDHIGGLGAFPAGVAIYAQANNARHMKEGAASGRGPVPSDHLPNHLVTNTEAVELDGVKFELLHWAPAHTDGDLVIYLPAQKIVFTGDIFALDQPRALIHREEGGTSSGWITTAQQIVGLDATRFVPGHGSVQSKPALEERIRLVSSEREQIIALVAKGETLAQVQSAVGDPPPGNGRSGPGGPRFTPFSEVVYQEQTVQK